MLQIKLFEIANGGDQLYPMSTHLSAGKKVKWNGLMLNQRLEREMSVIRQCGRRPSGKAVQPRDRDLSLGDYRRSGIFSFEFVKLPLPAQHP